MAKIVKNSFCTLKISNKNVYIYFYFLYQNKTVSFTFISSNSDFISINNRTIYVTQSPPSYDESNSNANRPQN